MSWRRKFIKKVAAGSTARAIGSFTSGMPASIYRKSIGANNRINDPGAQKLWGRTYEKGWESKL